MTWTLWEVVVYKYSAYVYTVKPCSVDLRLYQFNAYLYTKVYVLVR